jgi:hypothetical protein
VTCKTFLHSSIGTKGFPFSSSFSRTLVPHEIMFWTSLLQAWQCLWHFSMFAFSMEPPLITFKCISLFLVLPVTFTRTPKQQLSSQKIQLSTLENLPSQTQTLDVSFCKWWCHFLMLDSRNSKRKVEKSKLTLPQIKLVENMISGKCFWRFIKNCTSYELMKIWFNSNHSKIVNYQLIKVLKEKVLDVNLSS